MNPRSAIIRAARLCTLARLSSAFAPTSSGKFDIAVDRHETSFHTGGPNAFVRSTTTQQYMSFYGGGESGTSTSMDFAVDPSSDEAKSITASLGISPEQHNMLAKHAKLIVEWNGRLNLISRKDCNVDVVFGRHILPSVALAGLPDFPRKENEDDTSDVNTRAKIVDVGTGGGFPGVPLAIIYPDVDFLLVDSVGKKLKAIDEMVAELGLTNVQTHHGRAEEIVDDPLQGRKHKNAYDICVGRSVSALPRFCFWIQDLLKKKKNKNQGNDDGAGRLVYIIGGEVEKNVVSRAIADVEIDDLLECEGASDKRVLIIPSSDVLNIAKESGEKKQKRGNRKKNNRPTNNRNKGDDDGGFRKSKGKWTQRDNAAPKQRGYENFKRYGS